jgi:hypothetical protein
LEELRDGIDKLDAIQAEAKSLQKRASELEQLDLLNSERDLLVERTTQLQLAIQESSIGEIEAQARILCAKVGATVSELELVLTDRLRNLLIDVDSGSQRLSALLSALELHRLELEDAKRHHAEILPDALLHAEANAIIADAIGKSSIREAVQGIITSIQKIDENLKAAIDLAATPLPELAAGG